MLLTNLLALDEPIEINVIDSKYPKCKINCTHYKTTNSCENCNNYKYKAFWKENDNWNGILRV